jgi:hypothetical protein
VRNPERQAAKEAKIKAGYNEMVAERKYVKEYIIDVLSQRHDLQPSTIESIIYGAYEARRLRKAAKDRLLGISAAA